MENAIIKIKDFVIFLLIIFCFLMPYHSGWEWRFELSTASILFLSFWLWKGKALDKMGLRISRGDLIFIVFLGILIYQMSSVLIPFQGERVGIKFFRYSDWRWKIAPIFQAFNEEIVLRALLLPALLKVLKKGLYASLVAALGFGALHWFLYHFNLVYESTDLLPFTLINLVLFGFVCNDLYFRSGHIGYGAALHISWNLTRFGGDFWIGDKKVIESQMFNLLESSPWLTCALLMSYLGLWHRVKTGK